MVSNYTKTIIRIRLDSLKDELKVVNEKIEYYNTEISKLQGFKQSFVDQRTTLQDEKQYLITDLG